MRAPRRKRPMRRALAAVPTGVNIEEAGSKAAYVGSAEHKSLPSFAGAPKLRADASKCDPSLAEAATLTDWLRDAFLKAQFGAPWEGGFPRYLWYRVED